MSRVDFQYFSHHNKKGLISLSHCIDQITQDQIKVIKLFHNIFVHGISGISAKWLHPKKQMPMDSNQLLL